MLPDEKQQQNSEQISDANKIDSDVHLSTKKRVIFWLHLFSILLFALSITVLLALAWAPINTFRASDNFYYANQVTYQWRLGFITDLLISVQPVCPSGYSHAIQHKWGGTSFGCYCEPNPSISFVLVGYCTPSLIQQNCRNIEREDSFTTSYWRNASNFCIKRSATSFASEQKYDGSNKICGSSNSLVIVPAAQPCPFVNITANFTTLEANQATILDPDQAYDRVLFGITNATSPYSFYNYPISQFAVSQYEFCLIGEDTGVTAGHTDFILLNKKRGCAETGNFTLLDSMTEEEFFANNPALAQLQTINGFPPPNLWIYNLGYNAVPSWKYQCRHNMDSKFAIAAASDQLNFQFYRQYQSVSIAIVVFLAVLYAEFLVLTMSRLYSRQIYPVGFKQVYLPYDFLKAIARYIVDFVSKVTIFGMVFYLTWTSLYNWNWFISAINEDCPESNPQMLNNVLTPYTDLYLTIMQFCIGQFILCLLFLVFDLIHFIYVYKNQLKYYLIQSQGKGLVLNQGKGLNLSDTKQLDLDFIKDPARWVKVNDKGSERDRREDDFRVTMAMNLHNDSSMMHNDDEEMVKKPKIKKKKKVVRNLFQRLEQMQLEDQEQEEEKKEEAMDEGMRQADPFFLEQEMYFQDSSNIQLDATNKKERRRRN